MIPVQLCKLFFLFKAVFHLCDIGSKQRTALMWMAQRKSLKCFEIICEYYQIYPLLQLMDRFSFGLEFM